ncbi:hypothetical protein BV22DRAFT_616083 [Leucogyrophana mollusca]|uniref:Uncharacterized protein n=1 Tax=Leucogyrophana mollusca TaxID=85980 RepID=A0ACB8BCG9_9AGAM|nr:hypothetical protein BV22DRAFT_616083 [Leucogyrophana mollusca]
MIPLHVNTEALFAVWTTCLVTKITSIRDDSVSANHYSWLEDDFPEFYPMMLDTVGLSPEETVHYSIDAVEEWQAQFPLAGEGFVCLGPQKRIFALTMFHELHCLDRIRQTIVAGMRAPGHAQHCLNYMRMLVLCRADVTLEPIVYSPGKLGVDITRDRTCKDWTQVYREAERSWKQCKTVP